MSIRSHDISDRAERFLTAMLSSKCQQPPLTHALHSPESTKFRHFQTAQTLAKTHRPNSYREKSTKHLLFAVQHYRLSQQQTACFPVSSLRYSIRTSAPQRRWFSLGGIFKLLVFLAILGVSGWLIFQRTVHNQLHGAVHAKILEQISPLGLDLQLGDAHFTDGKGLTLDDINLHLSASQNSSLAVYSNLQVAKLQVHSHSTLTDLAAGALKPDAIELHRAKLKVVRGHDGQFDFTSLIGQLSQLSPGQTTFVPILLRDSEIEIVSLDQSLPTITLGNINFTVSPVQFQEQPLVHVQGEFSADSISNIEISLFFNQHTKTWNTQLSCDQANLSHDVVNSLPPNIAAQFNQIQNLSGKFSFNATASGNDRLDQIPTFELTGRLNDFSIDDPRLPVAIQGLSTSFSVNNQGIVVRKIQGLIDQTTSVDVSYTQVGLLDRKAWRCVGTVNQFVLNDRPRLSAWLPQSGHKFMNDFMPDGKGDITFDLSHDGNRSSRKITGRITDMSFAFIKMPYRFDHCTGEIKLNGSHCDFSIDSSVHRQPVNLAGYADNIGIGSPSYRINLSVPGDVPIDEKLLASTDVNPNLSRVIRSFRPSGFVKGRGVIERLVPNGPINKWFDIRINECSVTHVKFPYPIHHVRGQILVNNSNYKFQNLFGHNNNGRVKCNGNWEPIHGLNLTFEGQNVPLDDQLRQALQPEIQEIWDGFRPRGTVEKLDVFVKSPIGAPEVDLQIEATFSESDAAASNYVSIFPVWFPYQINHLTGKLIVGQGQINLVDASARHHKTRFACEGLGRYSATDWSLRLKNLLVTSLPVDTDLLAAVPQSLVSPLAQLRFEGLANVSGEVTLAGAKIHNDFTPTPNFQPNSANRASFAGQAPLSGRIQQASHSTPTKYAPPESSMAWDVRINTNQANMLVGLPLKNVFGGVRLTGIYDGENIECDGHLDLDSMTVYDNQVTQITGPFRIDNQRVTAGKFVERLSPSKPTFSSIQTVDPIPAESISGILYKGVLRLDAHMDMTGKNEFFVRSTIADGCIATTCQQIAPELENVSGHGFAVFEMTGDASGTHSHRGTGNIRLRDAEIYELPIFISLLKLINIRQLTRTAFDSSNIDFNVIGERIVFERMEFIGDAISLLGDGEMNLDWDIDLNFYTVIGRNRVNIPLISQLYRAGSQRTLAIKVDGKLDNPKTHSNVLPELNENVKKLFNADASVANRFTTPTHQPLVQRRTTRVGQNFFQKTDQQSVRIDSRLRR